MFKKTILIISIISLIYFAKDIVPKPTPVLAENSSPKLDLSAPQPIHTTSRFETKLSTLTTAIPQDTVYKDDPQTEIGNETTLQDGSDGKKTTVTQITYYEGKEYDRKIISTDIAPAIDKIISRGTKIVWRALDTPDGPISYWKKLRVWATQYDSHCPGCDNYTATGLAQGKGVIAVDPSVIKLGSKLYVPGYGESVAGDTGGSIKGNIIDLGFPDAHTSGWYSHFVDIYLQ
jgi:resuscitation-promoting factor RpfB